MIAQRIPHLLAVTGVLLLGGTATAHGDPAMTDHQHALSVDAGKVGIHVLDGTGVTGLYNDAVHVCEARPAMSEADAADLVTTHTGLEHHLATVFVAIAEQDVCPAAQVHCPVVIS